MALLLLIVVALFLAAGFLIALPRLQDAPVRVRIAERPRRNRHR